MRRNRETCNQKHVLFPRPIITALIAQVLLVFNTMFDIFDLLTKLILLLPCNPTIGDSQQQVSKGR